MFHHVFGRNKKYSHHNALNAKVCTVAAIMVMSLGSLLSGNSEKNYATSVSYKGYGEILKKYVDCEGLVDYRGLKNNADKLDLFIGNIGALNREVFKKWEGKKKIAFWINAYNALTLRVVLNNYASGKKDGEFPENSIRLIKGVWDKITFRVMGQDMTLNQIEHERLRKNFNEPRIHMAIVCASLGCPFLRNEPFTAEKLGSQLKEQTKKFLGDKTKLIIDQQRRSIGLSPIFKWFGADFIKTYGIDTMYKGKDETQRAVLNFISLHVEESKKRFIDSGEYSIQYLEYDWALNEQFLCCKKPR